MKHFLYLACILVPMCGACTARYEKLPPEPTSTPYLFPCFEASREGWAGGPVTPVTSDECKSEFDSGEFDEIMASHWRVGESWMVSIRKDGNCTLWLSGEPSTDYRLTQHELESLRAALQRSEWGSLEGRYGDFIPGDIPPAVEVRAGQCVKHVTIGWPSGFDRDKPSLVEESNDGMLRFLELWTRIAECLRDPRVVDEKRYVELIKQRMME